MMSAPGQTSFPADGARVVVYRARRVASTIDDHVFVALNALRDHSARIVLQLPQPPTESDRLRLREISDAIVLAVGTDDEPLAELLDAWHRDGTRFDEVILTDDSWFGPVASFAPVFARMDPTLTAAWTMTPADRPDAAAWVAIRRARETGGTWSALLSTERIGTVSAFPSDRYTGADPVLVDSHRLLADGCPLLGRRVFTESPLVLERHAVIGRDLLREASERGYTTEAILQNLAKTVAPRRLNASLGLLDIPRPGRADDADARRVAVLAHFERDGDPDELVRRVGLVPGACDIIATTVTPGDADMIREALSRARGVGGEDIEVRVVPSGADDISATFVACRDVLLDDRHDVIVKLHSGCSVGRSANARRFLGRHTWGSLLDSGDHASRVLALFGERGLGLVLPPTPHIGFDTLGSGWEALLGDAERLASMLGIRVPLGAAPLRPVGRMWIARPRALRLIAEQEWSWADYLDGSAWDDLGAVQEALLAHGAGQLGFHTRTVLTPNLAAISHAPLEDKIDQLASTTPGFPVDRVDLLHRLGWVGSGTATDFARMYLRANRPALLERFPAIARFAAARHGIRSGPIDPDGGAR
jgi:rhamnosyltransferase